MLESIKNLFRKKPVCRAVPWNDDTPVLVEKVHKLFSVLPTAEQLTKRLKTITRTGFKVSDFTKKRS